MNIFKVVLIFASSVIYSVKLWAAPVEVISAKPESPADTRYEYAELILKNVLKTTEDKYGSATHKHASEVFSRDRALVELIKGNEIHVTAETPKDEWAKELLPIYIPINKGITGYRVYFVSAATQAEFSKIDTLDELKRIKTGSGSQWSTTPVLRQAGFTIIATRKLDGLFWMLMGDRFQALPRGINEAPEELIRYQKLFPDIRLDENLAVYIPLPTFFYVSPKHKMLAERLKLGLDRMYADGSFDKIFYSYHLKIIEDAKLTSRKVFKLKNTTLPKEVPVDEPKYWYKPGDELSYKE